jgi:hypothetical protein
MKYAPQFFIEREEPELRAGSVLSFLRLLQNQGEMDKVQVEQGV